MTDPAKVRRHAERVRELVASVVRTQIKDPRLGMITITDARITADLRDATVFYTVLGDAAAQAGTAAALESAKGMLRSTVGKALGLRHSPTLAFVLDDVQDQVKHIDDLLAAARQRRRRGAAAGRRRQLRGRRPAVRLDDDEDEDAGDEDDRGRRAPETARRAARRRPPVTDSAARRLASRPPRPTGPPRSRRSASLPPTRGCCSICHVNPDGDALGSMLGFGLGLRRLGVRQLQATFPGPLEVPEPFRRLPGLDLLVPAARGLPGRRTW